VKLNFVNSMDGNPDCS